MSSFKFSVIVPVIYLTDYSRKAMRDISKKADYFQQIFFILSCSESVKEELHGIFCDSGPRLNVKIVSFKFAESNLLRHNGIKYADTDYIYYQDCDDIVNYETILDNLFLCTGDNIICFNISKRIYDDNGVLVRETKLYSINEGIIDSIQYLPTNIVNKLIPKTVLSLVSFYNIPFSQDLSLSFQLYGLAKHIFVPSIAYIYENNMLSTSGIKKTKYNSLLRVAAMERILMDICSSNIFNKAYVQYRYELILNGRFAFLNKVYWPSLSLPILSIRIWGLKSVLKHIYHYTKAYVLCFRKMGTR